VMITNGAPGPIRTGDPLLAKLVVNATKDSIELSNGIRIEKQTSDHKAVRGRTVVSGICDELAFWPSNADAASPDTETLNALSKCSANIPNSMQVYESSPYARVGALYEEGYVANYGKDTDELCWMADSRSMNPLLDQKDIDRDIEKDSAASLAEYGFCFRSDVAGFLSAEAIQACVVRGRYELAPSESASYCAFCDPSGGASDSMTLAIAHGDHGVVKLDLLREIIPPFSPEQAVRAFADELRRYRCYRVVGDRYAAAWVVEQFAKLGINYVASEAAKSDIYLSFLPMVNSKQIELLDNRKLISQFMGLERRTRSGGRDIVDHRDGFHDDVSNAAGGACVLAGANARQLGFVDYLVGLAKGVYNWDTKFDWEAPPENGSVVKVDPHAAEVLRAQLEAQNRTSNPFSAAAQQPAQKIAGPPCPHCHGPSVQLFTHNFKCLDGKCDTTFQEGPGTQYRHNRTDFFAGKLPGFAAGRGSGWSGWRR
jgi:hypothetical protein